MSGAILNFIKKKESIRQKLKLSPSSHVKGEVKKTCAKQLSACCGTAVMSFSVASSRPQHKPKAFLVYTEVIDQTRGRVFPPISKHRGVGWKNEAQPSFFLTNFEVFDIASQTIDNSWRNSKQKLTKFYDN